MIPALAGIPFFSWGHYPEVFSGVTLTKSMSWSAGDNAISYTTPPFLDRTPPQQTWMAGRTDIIPQHGTFPPGFLIPHLRRDAWGLT